MVRSCSLRFLWLLVLVFPMAVNAASYSEVWSAVEEGPYSTLPEYHTTFSKFFSGGINLLKQSADRTLSDESDILPHFQKLVHPIGICFSGIWNITEQSRYTGYFAKGSKGLIIVRASEAMGNADRGEYRAFGFAGKIFPTLDKQEQRNLPTANFFTVDDLGGTKSDSYLDLPKLNEPKVSFHLGDVLILPTLTEITKIFASADSNPGIRPLYPISELTLSEGSAAVTPHWMMIQPITQPVDNVDSTDFRDELRLANYPGHKLQFAVLVSDSDEENWTRLGSIELTQEALSDGCDHELHFAHPRSRD